MMKIIQLCLFLCISLSALAQKTFPVNGSQDIQPRRFAFVNATIVVSPSQTIEHATLLIKDDQIEAVGKQIKVPKGYVTQDLQGKFIYPSFIDAFSTYGMPAVKKAPRTDRGNPIRTTTKPGAVGWNEAIRPETRAEVVFSVNNKQAEPYRANGFGLVQSLVKDGIARGSSSVVSLTTERRENEVMVLPESGAQYSFDKGSSKNLYPLSLMGSIALLRQTYYDAAWYKQQTEAVNISLRAFNRLQELPQFFEAEQMLDIMRAQKIAKEFNTKYIIKATGEEYQRIDLLKGEDTRLIVPLNFPATYDVEDPVVARKISLEQLKHWELAPGNPGRLEHADISFALTSYGLKSSKDFWKNIRKAIAYGLTQEAALKALTTVPAAYLGIADRAGTLEAGKLANFIICSDSLFRDGNVLFENWIQGDRYVINTTKYLDFQGSYDTEIAGIGAVTMQITGSPQQLKLNLKPKQNTSAKYNTKIEQSGDLLYLNVSPKQGSAGVVRISAYKVPGESGALQGDLVGPDGETSSWSARYVGPVQRSATNKQIDVADLGNIVYPFTAFGHEQAPEAESVIFKNATIWTNEAAGIVEHADIWIEGGKIKAVGENLSAKGAKVIDATGKHVTPGIIDEHSHIAASGGINESAEAVTAEVRIGDVIDSENINIYRQLAGGVTTSHILHGSANPIGGQSQLIKLRWGEGPEDLKFGGNDGFIKFALGENVKQSNWGDANKTRFPQTRMGVEQVFVDAFTRAKEYQQAKASGKLVRRDLELDALEEILENKRFITCHSYVQSEINMLMHVADSMGFKINTFTHILEGYKVADGMAKRHIAGSTFGDWWAYKMEVAEAIPYNAYLMHEQGVLTGINSDDAEMARRLNQEAAKSIMYGGLSEEEAFKLVTLNPAKMLHIDDRVGSLKVGKDADIVLWSDNPLSIYAKAEMTFVDGKKYWDIQENEIRKETVAKEKTRLIQKSLLSKKSGARTQKSVAKPELIYHCETLETVAVD